MKLSRVIKEPVGVCSVFHEGLPHIICPIRLLGGKELFDDLANRIFGSSEDYHVIKEPSLGRLGRIDYVIARVDNKEVREFFAVEVVALDTTTTGNIIRARNDFFESKMKDRYEYGINWRNVIKRTIPQIITKGSIFERWGCYIIWVMQDVLFNYLDTYYSISSCLKDGFPSETSTVIYIRSLRYDEIQEIYVFNPPIIKYGKPINFQQIFTPLKIPSLEDFKRMLLRKIYMKKGGASIRP